MATPAFSEEVPDTAPLAESLSQQIMTHGPMLFRDFMQAALYDSTHGYYSQPSQRVGKQGDFITSVSIGPCFGLILARRLADYWSKIGKPSAFHIIEPGAHDGALCHDLLTEARKNSPDFFQALHYHLIETSPSLRTQHAEKLAADFDGKFSSRSSFSEIQNVTGAILSNELIDAFPVDLIRRRHDQWQELRVDHGDDGLSFIETAISDPALADFCHSLDQRASYPDGYTTEYNPGLRDFAESAGKTLESGLLITIDYGHHADDYYHPDRSKGTLQTYHQHQKSDNPLASPGEIDITCHVDFSRLEKEARLAGFHLLNLSTQASWLTHHAKSWLLELEQTLTAETPHLLRQFQTLTHPAMLGTRFMVLEMEKPATDRDLS